MCSNKSRKQLQESINQTKAAVIEFQLLAREDWKNKLSPEEYVVFLYWANKATNHLLAVIALCEADMREDLIASKYELVPIANIHYRQMVELFLQVKYLAKIEKNERPHFAEKAVAFGVVEYLRKMEIFRDDEFAQKGISEMEERLKYFSPEIIQEIQDEKRFYWFGKSFSQLASEVSTTDNDFKALYGLVSAHAHGIWDIILGVSNPQDSVLRISQYQNKNQKADFGRLLIEEATIMFRQTWNAIAVAVGAPLMIYKLD